LAIIYYVNTAGAALLPHGAILAAPPDRAPNSGRDVLDPRLRIVSSRCGPGPTPLIDSIHREEAATMAPLLSIPLVLITTLPTAEPPQGRDEWKPAEAQLQKLDAEFRLDGWGLRPPKGAKRSVREDVQEKRVLWGVSENGPLMGVVAVNRAKGPSEGAPLEQAILGALDLAKQRATNLANNPVESGTINGQPFARARFAADRIGDMQGPVYGFMYVTYMSDASKTPIVLMGYGKAEAIETLEAAAQTFRLLP
jgi:hypothetical protein